MSTTYFNLTGKTIIVRSSVYPKMELRVLPGTSITLDSEMSCDTTGLEVVG